MVKGALSSPSPLPLVGGRGCPIVLSRVFKDKAQLRDGLLLATKSRGGRSQEWLYSAGAASEISNSIAGNPKRTSVPPPGFAWLYLLHSLL